MCLCLYYFRLFLYAVWAQFPQRTNSTMFAFQFNRKCTVNTIDDAKHTTITSTFKHLHFSLFANLRLRLLISLKWFRLWCGSMNVCWLLVFMCTDSLWVSFDCMKMLFDSLSESKWFNGANNINLTSSFLHFFVLSSHLLFSSVLLIQFFFVVVVACEDFYYWMTIFSS